MDAKRRRWWSMGPVGWALCVPLAGLVWAAATGYDLRYQLLWCINEVAGTGVLFYFVGRVLSGHYFTLFAPSFGGIELGVVLLVLHFSARPIGWWRYSLLVVWALLEPALLWVLPRAVLLTPSWYPARSPIEWTGVLTTGIGCGTGLVVWAVTRSWRVGVLVGVAALVCYFVRHDGPMSMSVAMTTGFQSVPKYAYIGMLAATLAWWVWDERRRTRPEWACQACGYDLRGTPVGVVCPECGGPRGTAVPAQSSRPSRGTVD